MAIEKKLGTIEKYINKYRNILGVLILIMLIITSVLTYKNFDKQNQIIETGGFVDGKIKCACTQDAWDEFQASGEKYNIPNIENSNG